MLISRAGKVMKKNGMCKKYRILSATLPVRVSLFTENEAGKALVAAGPKS